MAKKICEIPTIPILLTWLVVSCVGGPMRTAEPTPEPTPEAISIMDGLDREVVLPAPAQRVVSMAPSNTEILYAIGAGSQVVGRDEFSDFPTEVQALPSIGGGFGDFNLEAIVDLEPDLVLAAEINTAEQVKSIEDLGLNVFLLANPTTIAEMYTNLTTVGQLVGRADEAASLISSLESRVADVESRLAGAPDRPKVFYELDGSDPAAPWTAGAETFINTLIEQAGGENIAASVDSGYFQLSIEDLLVKDPDIILLGDAAFGVTPEAVASRAGWDALGAVETTAIFPFDDNLASRPGPRLVDGLEQLAMLFHPDLFDE
jgi:iron complex transport system substrate-binding protein